MTEAKKPSNRGGKREGAGRKPQPKAAMRISDETWANTRIGKDSGITKERTFSLPTAAPGVIPKAAKMACDAAVADPMAYAAIESTFFEGQAFLGYPYLAELTQRAEYRRPSEIIAEELTRKWLKIVSTGSDEIDDKTDKIKAIEAEFKRLNVQSVFRKAAEQDGFYGKSQIYIDTGDTDNPAELKIPLVESASKIKKGGIRGLRTIEPIWTYPNQYDAVDPLSDNYYRPVSWYVMGKEVHASRLMTLVSREVPDILKPAYAFGGLSLSQMLKPYVDNWLRTRQSVSDAVSAFSIMVLSTDLTAVLNGGGGDMLFRRVDMFNRLRDNKGLMVTNKDTETMANVSMPLGSLDHLQAQAQEHMASCSGIPLIKLFSITPSGLNAGGDAEARNFDDNMDAMANKLFNPHIHRLLNLVQLSLFGEIDPEITFKWEPRKSLDKSELATTRKTEAETDIAYINAGVIMPEEARTRLASEVDSPYASLDLDVELPDAEGDDDQFQEGGQQDDEGEHSEITGDEVKKNSLASDAEHWITLHPNGKEATGTPALINGAGQIIGGAGGKLEGKVVHPKSKSAPKSGTEEQHAPALWLGKAKPELPNNGGAETTQEKPVEQPKTPAQQASEYADKLSETAKTSDEHTAARNAHVKAANLLGQKHEDWIRHFEQHKVHEKAAKSALRAEVKAGGGHIGSSREKEFSKLSVDEIGNKLSSKFGINFSNGVNVQAAKKQKDSAWNEYIKVRTPEARQKYDELADAWRKAARTHNVNGLTTYDINDASTGAKNSRKTIAAVDAALDGMVARGFDIKAAIGEAKVSFVPGTCREYGGLAWGGDRGHGYFTISHDKSLNPEAIARSKKAEKSRAEKGKPRWNAGYEGDDIADRVVCHELAHALGLQPHINSPKKLGALLKEMHGDNKQSAIDWIKTNISEYAAKNIHETDAELCSLVTSPHYVKGTLPEQFEKHVYDLFKFKGN